VACRSAPGIGSFISGRGGLVVFAPTIAMRCVKCGCKRAADKVARSADAGPFSENMWRICADEHAAPDGVAVVGFLGLWQSTFSQ